MQCAVAVGEGGYVVPPPGYLRSLRSFCDQVHSPDHAKNTFYSISGIKHRDMRWRHATSPGFPATTGISAFQAEKGMLLRICDLILSVVS